MDHTITPSYGRVDSQRGCDDEALGKEPQFRQDRGVRLFRIIHVRVLSHIGPAHLPDIMPPAGTLIVDWLSNSILCG